jgi:ABC-2 type transport system ATP-binding protein
VSRAAVRVDRLRVIRGSRVVLPELSCEIGGGVVTGLLGPSGSGKTTLIRSIVGVQLIAAGTVEVLGIAAGSRALRTRVAYMTQAVSVYRDLTVRENLRFFARILGAERESVARAMADVSLGGHADDVVSRLSGGEQARVSLAVALLGEPEVLVLDEPTVGLDPVLRRDLWALFHRLAERGKTLLVSSHVMDEAEHCDSLLLLRDGRLLVHSTPAEVLARTGTERLDDAFLALIEADA